MQKLVRALTALVITVVAANVLFWTAVGTDFSPVRERYEAGRIVRLGPVVLLFAHGSWRTYNGIEEHHSTFEDHDEYISKPTTEVVRELRAEGAKWIWGTWCYTGDHNYIRKDMVTGEETPWPKYVSRNKSRGKTLPVWTGLGFYRIGYGEEHYQYNNHRMTFDTITIGRSHYSSDASPAEELSSIIHMEFNNAGLPQIDSITGFAPDTLVYQEQIPESMIPKLFTKGAEKLRDSMYAVQDAYRANFDKRIKAATKVEPIQVWIRGKPIQIWAKVEPIQGYNVR